MIFADLERLAGYRQGIIDVPCPLCGPGRRSPRNRKRKVLCIWHNEPDFASFNCIRCGESGGVRRNGDAVTWRPPFSKPPASIDHEKEKRIARAKRLWAEAKPLNGTRGAAYFTVHRGLDIDTLGDLSHCLRWHQDKRMVVALMCDPITAEPCGVHRTFLNSDGSKHERKMLGRQGVVMLSHPADVSYGLGVCEGVEDALAILLMGWKPVWAATSAGAIRKLPALLPGIEALTVFADADEVGRDAARVCVETWHTAGREATILLPPKDGFNG